MKLYATIAALFVSLLFTATVNAATNDWIELPEKQDVALQKSWTLNFSKTFTLESIDGAVIEKDGQFLAVDIEQPSPKTLKVTPVKPYEANTDYTLRVFLNNGKRYTMNFHTTDDLDTLIETIAHNGRESTILRVPAMPEKGFNFPYYIRIPSDRFKHEYNNATSPRYVLMDTVNNGASNLAGTEFAVLQTLSKMQTYSASIAERLWTPMIMPAVPRTNVYYSLNNEDNAIYEHALDRDVVRMEQLLQTTAANTIQQGYQSLGLRADQYMNYDEQLIAMFKHAAAYLNAQGHQVMTDQMFLSGYSAGGTFTDRLTMLQPQAVKAVASGATLDDMVMPVAKKDGQDLIFPVGVADYEEITGRTFRLADVNRVAKLIYMGKNDQNDTLPYGDTFGDTERQLIKTHFGEGVLPRARNMMNFYHAAGGEAMFILDAGVAHSQSPEMTDYILQFFRANRSSTTPSYPIPTAQNLEYQLHP